MAWANDNKTLYYVTKDIKQDRPDKARLGFLTHVGYVPAEVACCCPETRALAVFARALSVALS